MIVKRQIHRVDAIAPKLPEGNYLSNRIGFWALVTEQNSLNNTVTVVSDTGYELKNIPVKSDEWVTIDDNKNYVPSQRNLPPVNSRVFVLTPTYSAMGAFVLCSGFSRGDENIRKLWAASESELNDKNNSRETKTQGGWDITEEYSNGNFSVSSNDGNIKFNVNTTLDNAKSQPKEVSVTAWNNKIVIDNNGIKIADKNNNVIQTTANGLDITDKNGNKINTSATNLEIYGKETNKIKIGNNSGTIKKLLSDLLTKLNSGTVVTAGNESAQAITAAQFTDEITELNNILE